MTKIIDTNLLLRLILNDIPEQTELVKKLLNRYSCSVLDISIFECVYVLRDFYNMPAVDILESLQTVLLLPNIEFNKICLLALALFAKTGSLSFADCYLIETAKAQKTQLFTFDKLLIRRSGGLAVRP